MNEDNEQIIRSSLDQTLLGVAALEAGEYDKALAHGSLATAFATLGGGGTTAGIGPSARGGASSRVISQWMEEIRVLALYEEADEVAAAEAKEMAKFRPAKIDPHRHPTAEELREANRKKRRR